MAEGSDPHPCSQILVVVDISDLVDVQVDHDQDLTPVMFDPVRRHDPGLGGLEV